MADLHVQSAERASTSQTAGDPGKLFGEAWGDLGNAVSKIGEASTAATVNAANAVGNTFDQAQTMAVNTVVGGYKQTSKMVSDTARAGQEDAAAVGHVGYGLLAENVGPIASSVQQGVHDYLKTRPITRQFVDSVGSTASSVAQLGFPEAQLAQHRAEAGKVAPHAPASPKRTAGEQAAKEGKGSGQSDSAGKSTDEQEKLDVKAGDGYWRLAARELHLNGHTLSEQQNDALLRLMDQLEKLNGNRMLHVGDQLIIPPLSI